MLNQVILQGRLTANPELKYTKTNVAVTSFSIAVEENRTVNDERKTNFFHCVAWRSCAEFICKYFEKGKHIQQFREKLTEEIKAELEPKICEELKKKKRLAKLKRKHKKC